MLLVGESEAPSQSGRFSIFFFLPLAPANHSSASSVFFTLSLSLYCFILVYTCVLCSTRNTLTVDSGFCYTFQRRIASHRIASPNYHANHLPRASIHSPNIHSEPPHSRLGSLHTLPNGFPQFVRAERIPPDPPSYPSCVPRYVQTLHLPRSDGVWFLVQSPHS